MNAVGLLLGNLGHIYIMTPKQGMIGGEL